MVEDATQKTPTIRIEKLDKTVHHRKIIRPSKILAKKWTMKLTKVTGTRRILHTTWGTGEDPVVDLRTR